MFKHQEKLFKRLDKLHETAIKNAKRGMFRAVSVVQNEAVSSIARGPKTGPIVVRYNPRRTHQASAAGEPPATDQGFLVSAFTNSIDVKGGAVIGQVINSAPYAAPLEYGTTTMAARPFMQPALTKSAEKINDIFREEGLIV